MLQIVDKNQLKLLIFRGFAVDCRFIELFSCRLQTDYNLCMVKLQMQIFEKKMMQIVDRMAEKVVINIQSDPPPNSPLNYFEDKCAGACRCDRPSYRRSLPDLKNYLIFVPSAIKLFNLCPKAIDSNVNPTCLCRTPHGKKISFNKIVVAITCADNTVVTSSLSLCYVCYCLSIDRVNTVLVLHCR